MRKLKMDLREAVFDKEAFREELGTPEAESSKAEGVKPRDTRDLSGTKGR